MSVVYNEVKWVYSILETDTQTYQVSKEHSLHGGLWLAKIEPLWCSKPRLGTTWCTVTQTLVTNSQTEKHPTRSLIYCFSQWRFPGCRWLFSYLILLLRLYINTRAMIANCEWWWIESNMAEAVVASFTAFSWHLLGGTEKMHARAHTHTHKYFSQRNWCHDQALNQVPPNWNQAH